MTSSVSYSRPAWCQEELHRWAMWRMAVNQELIHGLDGIHSHPGGQPYHAFTDSYSVTQRYMKHPEVERDQTIHIRNAYGMPPSPKYPMGDTLYFLYGLPRVTASVRVPDVISSHYASMPNLTMLDSRDENVSDNRSEPVRYPSTPAHSLLPQTKPQGPRQPESTSGNLYPPVANNEMYPDRQKALVEEISERHSRQEQSSPVNFRDKPETDFTTVPSTEGSEKVNNINKPVLVSPSVFQSEVQRRSNINLPLNINGEMEEQDSYDIQEGFEDPRLSRFNERSQAYTWSDNGDTEISRRPKYVDESHMKTHV